MYFPSQFKLPDIDVSAIPFSFWKQIKEETAKLVELKKKIDNEQGSQKFVLKTPKVYCSWKAWKNSENKKMGEVLSYISALWVIVKKSSPKNLSADRRPTVGRQTADRFCGELFFTITALWAKHQIIVFFCLKDCLYLLSLFPRQPRHCQLFSYSGHVWLLMSGRVMMKVVLQGFVVFVNLWSTLNQTFKHHYCFSSLLLFFSLTALLFFKC